MGSTNQPISRNTNGSGDETSDSLSGKRLSGSRRTERVFGGAQTTGGHQTMASSDQPNSRAKTFSDSSPERTNSGPGNTEKNVVEASVGAGHQASPNSSNANGIVRVSSVNSPERTISENTTKDVEGTSEGDGLNMASPNQLFSSNAYSRTKTFSVNSPERTISGPGSTGKKVVEASVGAGHQASPNSSNANGIVRVSSDNSPERTISGSENNRKNVEGTSEGAGLNMASPNQPFSSNAYSRTKTSSVNSPERTISGPGSTGKKVVEASVGAGHQASPNSSNANTRATASSGNSSERTISGPGSTGKNVVEASVGAGHQASSNQLFSSNASVLKAEVSPANIDSSNPSSLRSSSICTSYSLEISLSTANTESESQPLPLQTPPDSRTNQNKQIHPPVQAEETKLADSSRASPPKTLHRSGQPVERAAAKVTECTGFSSMSSFCGKLGAQPLSKPASQPPESVPVQSSEEMDSFSTEKISAESEELRFYAFVILHAAEDAEEASRLKARLERVASTTGATFAEDFAEPGRSTFRCMEDAINNSAYSILLLTANFNTRLSELNVDSALINSIEKPHKYNTVIPLLPRDNSLAASELPMVLKAKFPMKEKDKAFEVMARKVLDPERIRRQKKIWKEDLLVRKQRETQQRLQDENRRRRDLIRESAKVRELEQQRMYLLMQQQHLSHPYFPAFPGGAQPFAPGPQQWQGPIPPQYSGTGCHQPPPSNIHIQNAKYIMIGNDSTMTVGGGGGENSSGDDES